MGLPCILSLESPLVVLYQLVESDYAAITIDQSTSIYHKEKDISISSFHFSTCLMIAMMMIMWCDVWWERNPKGDVGLKWIETKTRGFHSSGGQNGYSLQWCQLDLYSDWVYPWHHCHQSEFEGCPWDLMYISGLCLSCSVNLLCWLVKCLAVYLYRNRFLTISILSKMNKDLYLASLWGAVYLLDHDCKLFIILFIISKVHHMYFYYVASYSSTLTLSHVKQCRIINGNH